MSEQELLPLREAAERLGLSVDAIRQRIRRGQLRSLKGNDGLVRVYLAPDTQLAKPSLQPSRRLDEPSSHMKALEAHIQTLREQIERERTERDRLLAERDRLLGELAEERRRSNILPTRDHEIAFLREQLRSRDEHAERMQLLLQAEQQQVKVLADQRRSVPRWWRWFGPKV